MILIQGIGHNKKGACKMSKTLDEKVIDLRVLIEELKIMLNLDKRDVRNAKRQIQKMMDERAN